MNIKPEIIVPFTLSKEDAKKNYLKKVKTAKLSEIKFRIPSNLDEFKKIYIPCWIVKLNADGPLTLTGSESHKNDNREVTNIFDVSLNLSASYNGIIFSATNLIEENRARELAPYPASVLTGYDESGLTDAAILPFVYGSENFKEDAINFIANDIFEKIQKTDALSQFSLKVPDKKDLKDLFPELDICLVPALLPVWMLVMKSFDRVSYGFVNGVTGKVSADLPVNLLKTTILSTIFALIAFVLISTLLNLSEWTWMWVSACLAMSVDIIYLYNCGALAKRSGYRRKKRKNDKIHISFTERVLRLFDTATDIDKKNNAKNFFFYLAVGGTSLLVLTVLAIFSAWLIPFIGIVSCLIYAIKKLRPRYLPLFLAELAAMTFAITIYLASPDNNDLYFIGAMLLNIVSIISIFVEIIQYNLLATTKGNGAILTENALSPLENTMEATAKND